VNKNKLQDVTNKIDFDLATAIMICEAQHGVFRTWIPQWSYDMYKGEAEYIAVIIKERTAKLRRRKTRHTTPANRKPYGPTVMP